MSEIDFQKRHSWNFGLTKETNEIIKRIAESKMRGEYKNCLTCGEKMWVRPSQVKIGREKFCSKKCYTESQRKPLPDKIPESVHQVMLGSLFGDGSICSSPNGKALIYFEGHSEKQFEYLKWKHKIFKKITKVTPIRFQINNSYHFSFNFTNFLKPYHKMFYKNSTKKNNVTMETLNQLTPLGIAVWMMDDGCYNYDTDCHFLSTNSFKFRGSAIIQEYFKKRWGLISSVHRCSGQPRVYFNRINTLKLIQIVEAYIHSTMTYKIGSDIEKSRLFKKNLKERKKGYNRKYRQKNIEKIREYDRGRKQIRNIISNLGGV